MNNTNDFYPGEIAIYSLGLLGASLGLSLKTSGYSGKITGLSSKRNIDTALSFGSIDEGYPYEKLEEVLKTSRLLIICSPIHAIIKCIKKLGRINLPEGLIITDIGSTKNEISKAAEQYLPKHVHFIGGHPMAGSEKSGPSNADPYLFQNAIYVLTAKDGTPSPLAKNFASFMEKNTGCRHLFLDPDTHDTIAAAVSHLPQIIAVALVKNALGVENKIPGTLNLAAGGFRDITRIASSPASMWNDILTTNKTHINKILSDFLDIITGMKDSLNRENLIHEFKTAAETRSRIPSRGKGFISHLSEVLVVLKDQPGMIADISKQLADEGINIKDIEVLKVREGEGGTLRLAFDNSSTAKKAASILTGNGFSARERNE